MSSQFKVLQNLAAQTAPVTQQQLTEILHEKQGGFKSQLDLLEKRGWAEQNENKEWIISDAGRNEFERQKKESVDPDAISIEAANLAPYEQFIADGKAAGVQGNAAFFEAVANYVWRGGNFNDPAWVEQALADMGIRPDVGKRWVLFWAGRVGQKGQRPDIGGRLKEASITPEERKKKEEEEVRDYILDENDLPQKVGADVGTMTYKDAMELSKVRSLHKARAGMAAGASGNKSITDTINEIMGVADTLRGNQAPPKSFIVKPGPDGQWNVETIEPGAPMVIPSAPATTAKKEFFVWKDGVLTKMDGDQPILLPASPPAALQPPKRYVIDSNTGTARELGPDEPLVIIKKEPAPAPPVTLPVQPTASLRIPSADGQPDTVVSAAQLDLYLRINDWREDNRRKEESHQARMQITDAFKDLLKKAPAALDKMTAGQGGQK